MGYVERLMTTKKTYYPLSGLVDVNDASIAYVTMLMVARSGMLFDIIVNNNDIAINTRQVRYAPSFGALFFNDNIPFNQGEDIEIVYKTI